MNAVRGVPPEEVLVALAAIYRCNEQWLEELTPWRDERLAALIERDYAEKIPDAAERQQIVRQLARSIEDFNRRFAATRLFVDPMSDRRHLVAFYDGELLDGQVPICEHGKGVGSPERSESDVESGDVQFGVPFVALSECRIRAGRASNTYCAATQCAGVVRHLSASLKDELAFIH